jgi:hypothetical protein
VLLLAAGCGGKGTLSPKAVRQEATGLQSLAAEGNVLAGDAARGRTTSSFLRVHAESLAKAAHASVTTLAAGGPPPTRTLHALGTRVASSLDRLSRSGSDRAQLQQLADALSRAAVRAEKLGQSG